jgi:hypothetical protein
MSSCSAGCCLCSWKVLSVRVPLIQPFGLFAITCPSEDMRRNQHLITNDVVKYTAEYEVGVFYSFSISGARLDSIPASAW